MTRIIDNPWAAPSADLNEVALLAVDVGFSDKRPTTGLAWSIRGQVGSAVAGRSWAARQLHIPKEIGFALTAIDGPLVGAADRRDHKRTCETVFARRPFARRCKPGFSHFGTGLQLRDAARATADQVAALTAHRTSGDHRCLVRKEAIVEAFPNTFLGVLLDDGVYAKAPKLRRGERFDWLYGQAVEEGRFEHLMASIGWQNAPFLARLHKETHHERRAALVCLLTAACAYTGRTTVVGDPVGGWFWLPPRSIWAPWALTGLRAILPGQMHPHG